jgi:hypothetical protein
VFFRHQSTLWIVLVLRPKEEYWPWKHEKDETVTSRGESSARNKTTTTPKYFPDMQLGKNEEFRQTAIAVASEIWMILAPLTGRRDVSRSERLSDTSKKSSECC